MENISIIKAIVAADRQGRAECERARAAADGLEAALEAEREQMRRQYFERADRHIAAVAKVENAEAEEQLRRLDEQLAESTAQLRELVERSADEWVDALYELALYAPERD